jgi:methionyl-tRNA formyltransferase
MNIRAVFFCGDRSRYGIAHLEAIAEHFDLRAIVIADDARWKFFRDRLAPPVLQSTTLMLSLRRQLGDWVRAPRRAVGRRAHVARLRATGAPLIEAHDANDEGLITRIRAMNPEVILSAAYPQIFGRGVLDLAPRGAVNFHPSLLPRCRGAHPAYWCIASGEDRGGVTAHFMTERIDDGDIVAQRGFSIGGLYYADVYARLVSETPSLVAQVATFLAIPDAQPVPQDQARATMFRNERDIHRRIWWARMDGRAIYDRIRAGNAFATFRGRKVVLARATVAERNRNMINGIMVDPGAIVDIDTNGLWLATRDATFIVVSHLRDRHRVDGFESWVARRGVSIGERLD